MYEKRYNVDYPRDFVHYPIGDGERQIEENESKRAVLQYFLGSVIEMTDPQGKIHTDLRIFREGLKDPDLEVPKSAFVRQLKFPFGVPAEVDK